MDGFWIGLVLGIFHGKHHEHADASSTPAEPEQHPWAWVRRMQARNEHKRALRAERRARGIGWWGQWR